jgi:MFS transporter, PAT family, beta-lactamase induction signal transducer AmpG
MPALARYHRFFVILLLGFASGLPLALSGQAMQAWLTVDGVDLVTIGFLGLVGLPYTFKFLWAPLMDRFEPPWLGRRRGWLLLSQLALAAVLMAMSHLSPSGDPLLFATAAVAIAFLSASQDIVVDAYRTDVLVDRSEHGLGASVHVFGYRVAMIVSGGIALIWADQWDWPSVYRIMAGLMLGLAVCTAALAPRIQWLVPDAAQPQGPQEIAGFLAMLAGVLTGCMSMNVLAGMSGLGEQMPPNAWRLLVLFAEIGVAAPLAWLCARGGRIAAICWIAAFGFAGLWLLGHGLEWLHTIPPLLGLLIISTPWIARHARFETFNQSLSTYFSLPGATAFLVLIVLYKLGDAFAGSLTTPFLIKGMGFTQAEVGIANKIIGIWLTIFGAFLGGLLMLHLKLYRALLVFGVLQLMSNLGFFALASLGKGAWGSVAVQPFDWFFMALKEPAALDLLLLTVIAGENISGGMGTVAFVGLLMALCNKRFTATHYALLSAFAAVGRIYVSPLAGVLSAQLGWPVFFVLSCLIALPGILMVWLMRESILALIQPANKQTEADT